MRTTYRNIDSLIVRQHVHQVWWYGFFVGFVAGALCGALALSALL